MNNAVKSVELRENNGVASRQSSHSRPITRPYGALATVHRKVASDKEGLAGGGFSAFIKMRESRYFGSLPLEEGGAGRRMRDDSM